VVILRGMDGWCSVADLTRWGFAHAQVVMVNEAHNGWARSVRTREVGLEVIRAAHEAGVRRLAMEALDLRPGRPPGPIREIAECTGAYLEQPDMRRLAATALELGWGLWAYEAVDDEQPGRDAARLHSLEYANWRDREQARNLAGVLAAAPGEPLLVWAGWGHIHRDATAGWVPMACHFPALAGTEPFIIDQTVSISAGEPPPWVAELLAGLGEVLAGHGGTAGILRVHAPPPLDRWHGVDAVVVSDDNELT
jgi:hypothetical protein